MSKRKTERLLGLVVCLLSTRRYLTADQVREAVPGYPEQNDLFKRMFERDTGSRSQIRIDAPSTVLRCPGLRHEVAAQEG